MKVLITGASGFTGRSLIRFLTTRKNVDIAGLARDNNPNLIRDPRISWFFADLLDQDALNSAVSSAAPDVVLHLAGLTRGTLEELRKANVDGTRNLLKAIIRNDSLCPIVVVSSSAVYGYAGNTPIPETQPVQPISDYGTSKAEQEVLCSRYVKTGDCRISIVRPFNLIGPGQPETFVCGKIVKQIVEIEQGNRTCLDLVETSSFRDFIDVRDVVQGYWSILLHPEFTEVCSGKTFNLGSGTAHSIADVIHMLESMTGAHYQVRSPNDEVPIRLPYQQSDNSRITAATRWTPGIPLNDTLRDMLDSVRTNVKVC